MSSPAVVLEQVFSLHRSAHGDAAALQGLTMTVSGGEVLCVVGPSGAGKSTLLRVVAGIQTPSAGEVRVLGRELGRLPARLRAHIRRQSIGFLGQNWSSILSPELPLRDAVALPLMLRGARRREARNRASALLEAAGLGDREVSRAGELSGGERQRAAVCAALAHRPALLLADEPTGDLDRDGATMVRALIGQLAQAEGTTVIVVSHDAATAGDATRILRLRDGRIEAELGRGGESRLVDPRGWVRLPPELLDAAGIGDHVHVRRADTALHVSRAGGSDPVACGSSAQARWNARARSGRIAPRSGRVAPSWRAAQVELCAVARQHRDGPSTRIVLDRLSLTFAPGRLTVVIGRSGAGKSTLLRVIARLEPLDGGEVLIDGRAYVGADGETLAAWRRERLGYLSQDPSPVGFLSAEENVALALGLRGERFQHAGKQAQAALAAVGLGERAGQRVSRLSAGEAQRVALARALACARGLLIVDEPTSRLDETTAGQVAQLLAEAARRAQTVICATHDDQLIACADEVVTLSG